MSSNGLDQNGARHRDAPNPNGQRRSDGHSSVRGQPKRKKEYFLCLKGVQLLEML
jgi:hypothetical protein